MTEARIVTALPQPGHRGVLVDGGYLLCLRCGDVLTKERWAAERCTGTR